MTSASRNALFVLVPFFAWSMLIASQHGALGFVPAALAGGWHSQIAVDLAIALSVCGAGVYRDARARGLNPWPWIVAMSALGSVGLLAWFVMRDVLAPPPRPTA